mgnify:CR=1 FL=1
MILFGVKARIERLKKKPLNKGRAALLFTSPRGNRVLVYPGKGGVVPLGFDFKGEPTWYVDTSILPRVEQRGGFLFWGSFVSPKEEWRDASYVRLGVAPLLS